TSRSSALSRCPYLHLCLFFFNATATTEIYTLSLHDALPIYRFVQAMDGPDAARNMAWAVAHCLRDPRWRLSVQTHKLIGIRLWRSEEHTSELQSRRDLVCRLLLEKKKKKRKNVVTTDRAITC